MKNKIKDLLLSTNRDGMENLVLWLENKTDFFRAPASTKFHGNYEGGLAEHSYNVYTLLKEKNDRYNLGLKEESTIISSILHDICKCNIYKKESKWRKDSNNKWEEYFPWVFDDNLPLGHGEKSVILTQMFIKLKREEIFLIRYHMLIPSIVAIHTADYEATTFLEKKVEI